MKRVILLFGLFALIFSPSLHAQTDDEAPTGPWTKGGMGSVTFNQVGLFNWAAGGQSNVTLIGNLNLFANKTWNDQTWENSLELAYGFIKNNFIYDPESRIAKAEDNINFNSKYGRKAWSDKFFYSGLVNFRTQFDYGRTNPNDDLYISRFLSPAYLIFAAGIDYKPNDKLSLFLSPASGKFTIVSDDSLALTSAFGVNQTNESGAFLPGNAVNTRMEVGATFRAKYKADIMENVGLESQLELFSNYIDRPGNIDLRWNNAIVAKVNKFIAVNIFTDMIYDHDIKIGRTDSRGVPVNSINPDPILDPNTGVFTPNTTFWPGPGYLDGSDLTDVVAVQKKGAILQFKEIFGVGVVVKF